MNQPAENHWEKKKCIALVSHEGTLGDMKTALSMLKINLYGTTSITEARSSLIDGDSPCLVLIEGDLEDSTGRVMSLAKSMKDHPDLQRVPVCLLMEDVEDTEGVTMPEMVDAIIKIPVEFPTFTKDIRAFLETRSEASSASSAANGASAVSGTSLEALQNAVSGGASEQEDSPAHNEPQSSSGVSQVEREAESVQEEHGKRLLDRRLIVAYGVQLAVLEELEHSTGFQSVSVEEIPAYIAEVTKRVCEGFDFEQILQQASDS